MLEDLSGLGYKVNYTAHCVFVGINLALINNLHH
jgi:hypothetical protein